MSTYIPPDKENIHVKIIFSLILLIKLFKKKNFEKWKPGEKRK